MKAQLGPTPFVYPVPIVLAGANVGGKPNFATLGDCGIMGINPPLVYISSHVAHHTNQGVLENDTYSVNFPSSDMVAVTDYCGIVSGNDVDKSTLFQVFYGELGTAPMIEDCPVNLECKVVKEFCIQHRQIFVGQVVQAYIDASFVTERDGRQCVADMTKLDPIIYALDNQYYRIGKPFAVGYREGKDFKPTS